MGEKIARKALLVYPEFLIETFWSFHRSFDKYEVRGKSGLPKRSFPPLGLMGLFRHLRPFYEEIELTDRNVDPRPLDELVRSADHVYLSSMIAQEQGLYQDIQAARAAGKLVIVGGTSVNEHSWLMQQADHLVENEAEMVIDDLLAGLQEGRAEKLYRGTPAVPERFFRPDFTSIKMGNYMDMVMQISRGCPEDCEFCDITARFGRTVRTTPWEYTEETLESLYRQGHRGGVFIVDDNFIGHQRRAVEILKKLYEIERRIGYQFPKYSELTMRLADETQVMEELRHWIHETNFKMNFIGVETNNEDSLRETGKLQNLRGQKSPAEKLRFISEQTGTGIMIGIIHRFDHDLPSVDALIDFINSTHVPVVMAGLLTALPYTRLWDRLSMEGRLMADSIGLNTDGGMNFIPYNFSARQADLDYVRLLEGIYNEEAYFTRVMRELRLLNPIAPVEARTAGEGLYSLARILTQDHAAAYWRHLPAAHRITRERFTFNSPQYRYILAQYLTHCARFTHLKGQTEYIKQRVQQRQYEPWQLHSWREIQESAIAHVEVIEPQAPPTISEVVRMRLQNGYEFAGTRLAALEHFVEPYLKEGLQSLQGIRPTVAHFLDVHVAAYQRACLQRPNILGGVDFRQIETYLHERLHASSKYLGQMRHLLKIATAVQHPAEAYAHSRE